MTLRPHSASYRPTPTSAARPRPRALLAAVAVALFTASCLNPGGFTSGGKRAVMIASTPSGAQVLVDGEDSGFVTPCSLRVGGGEREVEIRLSGYRPAQRVLVKGGRWFYIPWKDGDIGADTWRFPLWLDVPGLLFPVQYERGPTPARLHVTLKPSVD